MKLNRISLLLCALSAALLCGCGTADPDALLISAGEDTGTHRSVTVSTTDELLAAIAPDTTICLQEGTYLLSRAGDYGHKTGSEYYSWEGAGYGNYSLVISGVNNLTLRGESADKSAALLMTEPRDAYVLRFNDCDNISLESMTVGHTTDAGACMAGVVSFEDCDVMTVTNCGLFGCGTSGIDCFDSTSLLCTDTDIYRCSVQGFSLTNTFGAVFSGCRFYDCGSEDGISFLSELFGLNDCRDISISDCEVSNCFSYGLVRGEARNVAIVGTRVSGCHLSTVFNECSGITADIAFENNRIGTWFPANVGYVLAGDGTKLTSEELSERYREQMLSSGLGQVTVEWLTADRSERREVHVSTTDEFLAAIDSDTVIYIDAPVLSLTDASDYGTSTVSGYSLWNFSGQSYGWIEQYDGLQLAITNVTNLSIVGNAEGGTVISTDPRYAEVLSFYNCSGISLEALTVGHTKEPGACSGGVLYFEDCSSVLIDGCGLYGCGIYGITANRVDGMQVQNSSIYECSYGAAVISQSQDVVFLECTIRDVPSPYFTLSSVVNFSWNGTLMDGNSFFDVG